MSIYSINMHLTKIQCDLFSNDPDRNPLTGRKIKHGGATYNKIKKSCLGNKSPKSKKKVSFDKKKNTIKYFDKSHTDIDYENKVVFDLLKYILTNRIGLLVKESMYNEDENVLGKIDEIDEEFIGNYSDKLSRKNKKLIISSIKYLQNKLMKDVLINIFEKKYHVLGIDPVKNDLFYESLAIILIKIAVPTYEYYCKILCKKNNKKCSLFYEYMLKTLGNHQNIVKFNRLIKKAFSPKCKII